MYPEPDSRADEFDDALERRRAGDNTPADDQETQELVTLASRLDQELTEDIPDPAFRENLKHELLQGAIHRGHVLEPVAEPIDLADERWSRRLAASPWRLSAAAAACVAVVVVAFFATTNPFDDNSGDSSEEITSFQAVDADDSFGPDDGILGNQFPLDVDDNIPPSEQWFTASFPPFDVEHVVLPPLLIGFLPFADRHKPQVELNGVSDMANDVDMPGSASVYYLNAPPDGATMLTTLRSTLGIDGELVEGNGDGEPYRVIDDEENDVLRWDPSSAFFHFRGGLLDQPVDDLLDPDAGPVEIARRFLELIGFDLHTIDYGVQTVEHENLIEVQFRPEHFPVTALDVTLGGNVFVGEGGAVLEAQLYWLSLVDVEVVALREADAIMEDMAHDAGYSPPASDGADEMMINAEDMMMVHVLTRLGTSNFVLQPAVKVVGNYGDDAESSLPGPARYYVAAVDNGD